MCSHLFLIHRQWYLYASPMIFFTFVVFVHCVHGGCGDIHHENDDLNKCNLFAVIRSEILLTDRGVVEAVTPTAVCYLV